MFTVGRFVTEYVEILIGVITGWHAGLASGQICMVTWPCSLAAVVIIVLILAAIVDIVS